MNYNKEKIHVQNSIAISCKVVVLAYCALHFCLFLGTHSLNDSLFQLNTEERRCFSLCVGFSLIASVLKRRFSEARSIDGKNQIA